MKILDLFDMYFLIMIYIEGFVMIFLDYRKYTNENKYSISRKAKKIGIIALMLSTCLFVIRQIV